VGVDARQEGIQRRRVEGTVVVPPAPHDGVDSPCEVRFGETGPGVQPPGPHHRADLVHDVLADRRDEAGRDPSASGPDSPAPEPIPQERERRVLMRAAPPGVLAVSGGPGESHPRAPTDPCVTVSRYTAPTIQSGEICA